MSSRWQVDIISRMQKYELTVLVDGKLTPAKRKTLKETIEKAVGLLKGKVGTVVDWGEKELAQKIGKADKGFFIHFPLELTTDSAQKLSEKIKTENAIIRYLLVKV